MVGAENENENKKAGWGKKLGIGCLGLTVLFVIIIALAGGSGQQPEGKPVTLPTPPFSEQEEKEWSEVRTFSGSVGRLEYGHEIYEVEVPAETWKIAVSLEPNIDTSRGDKDDLASIRVLVKKGEKPERGVTDFGEEACDLTGKDSCEKVFSNGPGMFYITTQIQASNWSITVSAQNE